MVCTAGHPSTGPYGGVHYAAIGLGFPTAIEHLLWEISCFFLLGFAAMIPAFCGVFLALLVVSLVVMVVYVLGKLVYKAISEQAVARGWKSPSKPKKEKKESTAGEEVDTAPAVYRSWLKMLFPEDMPKSLAGKAVYWILYVLAMITGWVIFLVIYSAIIGLWLAYIAARLFIVVEVFISLRSVPIGVYQTPDLNFMYYVPHF